MDEYSRAFWEKEKKIQPERMDLLDELRLLAVVALGYSSFTFKYMKDHISFQLDKSGSQERRAEEIIDEFDLTTYEKRNGKIEKGEDACFWYAFEITNDCLTAKQKVAFIELFSMAYAYNHEK